MSDSSSNPFIGNPFAQGVDKQKRTPPPPATAPAPQPPQRSQPGPPKSSSGKASSAQTNPSINNGYQAGQTTTNYRAASYPSPNPQSTAAPRSTRQSGVSSSPPSATTTKSTSSRDNTSSRSSSSKTAKQTSKKLRRSPSQTNSTIQPTPPPTPAPAYSGSGYKVQVLAKIPLSTNTNLPSRDYLWFAVYPIIPRVGDCIFNNGMYFRVDAVFLYENTTPGWCADIEVSYYPRRR